MYVRIFSGLRFQRWVKREKGETMKGLLYYVSDILTICTAAPQMRWTAKSVDSFGVQIRVDPSNNSRVLLLCK